MLRRAVSGLLSNLTLNKKFLVMYLLCVIIPLVTTDFIVLQSMYQAEINDEKYIRENELEAHINYIQNLIAYDRTLGQSINVNPNLNSFVNKYYLRPYDYYDAYFSKIANSLFSTLTTSNQDKVIIYSDNNSIIRGNHFQNLSSVSDTVWYERFMESGKDEGVFVYYDDRPTVREYDRVKFVYVQKMNHVKSSVSKLIVIEHSYAKLRNDIKSIPSNCSIYICCDEFVPFSSVGKNVSIEEVRERAVNENYKTVKDVKILGTSFKFYAFTDTATVMTVIKDKVGLIVALVLFTLILPLVIMKIIERSIVNRIAILRDAFGNDQDHYFRSIPSIEGSDEIALLMYNYNRIADINNELTNTIYKDKLREQENDIARKNAELLALQSQINPHFLFNALESIRMHSILKGEGETAEMVQKLAVMERQNVEWHEDFVTIGEEESFIEAYLQLQSYRFGERISFDIDIDDDCRNILIPKLTLVTFVENACVHGIESKSSQGWIFVRVYRSDGDLILEVEDTGDGMAEDEVKVLERRMNYVTLDMVKKARHVGILNACLRMKLMFDEKARFTIESEKGIGMSVIITIPQDCLREA